MTGFNHAHVCQPEAVMFVSCNEMNDYQHFTKNEAALLLELFRSLLYNHRIRIKLIPVFINHDKLLLVF